MGTSTRTKKKSILFALVFLAINTVLVPGIQKMPGDWLAGWVAGWIYVKEWTAF